MERIGDKSKVDFFMAANANKFDAGVLMEVRKTLSGMTDNQFMALQAVWFREPALIFAIAFICGWERFFLDDVLLGVLKIITLYGLGLWWLVDLFTAMSRAKKFNYNRFVQVTSLMR